MVIAYEEIIEMAQDPKQEILASLYKHLDFPGFASDVINGPLLDELKKIVADTRNPFDDVLLAAIYPALSVGLNNAIKNYWAQLLVPAPAAPAPASPGGLGAAV